MEPSSRKKTKEEVILPRLTICYTRTTLTWSKAATNVSCMPDHIHCETHSHWMYWPSPYKRNLLLCKWHEGAVQNIGKKNVMSFLKAMSIYRKIEKKFQQDQISPTNCSSTRNTSTKSDPFILFTTRRFSAYKLSIKPDSFYKPFPY